MTLTATAALAGILTACAEAETEEPAATGIALEQPATATVFTSDSSEKPLPADDVFFPDAFAEDGRLYFRVQMLPGYYVYKDKIGVRSLSDGVDVDDAPLDDQWSPSEIVVDEYFGEQVVFFSEASGVAGMRQLEDGDATFEIELTYQGCKKEGLCYLPQSKVLSVALPTPLESAADESE